MESQNRNLEFMALYTPVHDRLCRYVQTLVWQPDDAKDMVSEITLLAFERFDTIKDHNQFVFYLFGIARNLFLKKLRRQKFYGSWNEGTLSNLEGTLNAEENVKKIELAKLLSHLEPIQREAITLYEISGFSYKEIAEIQHTNEQKVKATIYKGRQTLKALISEETERYHLVGNQGGETKLKMDGII